VVDRWDLHRLATTDRIDLARALLARDDPGDADRARVLLGEALEISDALGLVAAGDEVRLLLA
jgi:hypothetical protein